MDELKPCPFCGSDNLRVPDLFSYIAVVCDNCGTDGPAKKNEEEAIKAWNIRANESDHPSGLIKEAELQAELHPSKDARFFAKSVLEFFNRGEE